MIEDGRGRYLKALRGSFTAALRWHQLDALWGRVRERQDEGWYIYAVGKAPPQVPVGAAALEAFVTEIDQLLRVEHQEDYCGIVYADDPESPSVIKIYDPNNLGVSCGSSNNPPLPGWILSQIPPVELETGGGSPNNRRRWWRRLFSWG